MNWFTNLPTRTKLIISFSSMLVLLILQIVTAYFAVASIQDSYRVALDLVELRADMNRQRAQMLSVLLSQDAAERASLREDIQQRAREIDDSLAAVGEHFRGNPAATRKLADIQSAIADFRRGRDAQFALTAAGDMAEAQQVGIEQQEERFHRVRSLSEELGQDGQEAARKSVWLARVVLLGVGGLGILLSALLVLTLTRLIASPLASFTQFVELVGRGDLTQQTPLRNGSMNGTHDEVLRLGGRLNEMVVSLRSFAGQTRSATQNIDSAAAEIIASTQQQASSTKEQAATVQQVTSTMTEISQSGAQIVDKAKQVATSAEATSAASKSGIKAVQDTTRTMETIREQVEEVAENIVALSERTQAVGDIISTVNEIAEQSNLLALNAAIEAAAAGSEGNRFSVVANEMKNLADQAKQCTVQVRTILSEIQKGINSSVMLTEEAVKRVETGKRQADVSEATIREMTSTTEESVRAFQQIIGAANQQQIGFEQVTQGMQDIRQAAEQTATGTSQLEQAVANLSALSQQLRTAVATYKT